MFDIFEPAVLKSIDIKKLAFFGIYFFCAIAYFFGKTKKDMLRPLQPIIFAKSISKIKYAKQPPLLSLLPENQSELYQELPIADFLQYTGLKRWTDSLVANESDHPKIKHDYKNILNVFNPAYILYRIFYPLYNSLFPLVDANNEPLRVNDSQALLEKIEDRLLNPIDSFIICEIHPEVGKGVFLAIDAKTIAKNTIIGIYSGEYLVKKPNHLIDNTYMMSLSGIAKKMSFKNAPGINAKEYGNITRFFQDLPAEEELTSIPAKFLPAIATENLNALGAIYRGVPLLYFVTTRDIEPGEQIGFSYRGNYWIKGRVGKRKIFNKKCEIIGRFVDSNKIQLENSFIHNYRCEDNEKKIINNNQKEAVLLP